MPFCTKCGSEVSDKAVVCAKCGGSCALPLPLPESDEAALRMVLPIGRSGWAIAAGYLALFSLLVFPAPFALVAGIVALRDIRKHPDRLGRGRAWFGIIVGALFSVLLLAVLLSLSLAAVFGKN